MRPTLTVMLMLLAVATVGVTMTADERINGLGHENCALVETIDALRAQLAVAQQAERFCQMDFWAYRANGQTLLQWKACLTGPEVPAVGICATLDNDHDGDVDMSDYGVWQARRIGP